MPVAPQAGQEMAVMTMDSTMNASIKVSDRRPDFRLRPGVSAAWAYQVYWAATFTQY